MRLLILNFPEVGTPITMANYIMCMVTLGLCPEQMVNMELRPDSHLPGLYFTGQDVVFAGWTGAMTGAMMTTQCLKGYTLFDFTQKKTLMRDLSAGHVDDMIDSAKNDGWNCSNSLRSFN